MSNVREFISRLQSDKALREKLNAARDKYKSSRDYLNRMADAVVLPLAREAGLPFTIEELWEYERELRRISEGGEEP